MTQRDKVWRISGGPIVTMDTEVPVAGEVVICGGRIRWIGPRGKAPSQFQRTQVFDLEGRLLLPSFTDAHTHFLHFAQSLDQVNLHGVRSLRAALARIRRHVQAAPTSGSWVIGQGFDVNLWGGRLPTCRDLDRVTGERPAGIWSHDHHALWVNSGALRHAAITHATPDPDGGHIVHDARGRPTGLLLEAAAFLVWNKVPTPTPHQAGRLLLNAQSHAHEAGVTAIDDMGPPRTLSGFTALKNKGKLTLRVWKSIPLDELDNAIALGLRSGLGDEWLKIGAVKIFLDGALGSRTAWMYKPYTNDRRAHGIRRLPAGEFERVVAGSTKHGLSVCVHAIGDAAVGEAISVLTRYAARFPKNQPPRIEHMQLLNRDDLKKMEGSRIIASMQPSHLLTDRDTADAHWGRRARRAFAFRSLWDAGVTLAFGSDVPIEPLSPLAGIGAAVHRARPSDKRGSWYPQEQLSVWEAVWGFTVGGATASGEGHRRGRIIPGYLADLTILDRNIFTIPPREIFKTKVTTTILDGRIVWDAA